jgi:cytochrome d ubiquinol oxidase subunit I
MNDLIFARAQMAMSLAFHILFAAIGIGMPLLMVIAEGLYLRTREHLYLELSKAWARGTAVLFAIGAVSGTVLSFELGLLWPGFMKFAGGIIGLPFSLEGFAFFTEAIFLGIYLYGWGRVSPQVHWLAGLLIAFSGFISGAFVLTANGWMNAPTGFDILNGQAVNVNPIAAMLNPASLHEILHMNLAAYVATGFSAAAIHAFFLLRQPNHALHRRALGIALAMACITIPLQGLSGDLSARRVAVLQPAKLAAMEALYRTQTGAPLVLGGLPDSEAMTVRYGFELPYLLSLLAFRQPQAVVTGLEAFPRDQWPNVTIVHWSFDIMVACGLAMGGVAVWALWLWWRRRRLPDTPIFLKAVVAAGPLGFIAIETGWIVTEVGRQPWIIYQVMRTAEAVTPVKGLAFLFIAFTLLYLILAVILIFVLRRQFLATVRANTPKGGEQ